MAKETPKKENKKIEKAKKCYTLYLKGHPLAAKASHPPNCFVNFKVIVLWEDCHICVQKWIIQNLIGDPLK